jgi:hypothetical protein
MTLPLTLNDGSAFPARDLAIFLAAGVIIVSLIAASLRLPHLLRGLKLPPEPSHQEDEDRARVAAAEAAIQAIEQAQHDMGEGRGDTDLYADAGARIMELYRQRIDGRSKTGEEGALARRIDEIERRLRLAGLRAERAELISHRAVPQTLRRDRSQAGQRSRFARGALRYEMTKLFLSRGDAPPPHQQPRAIRTVFGLRRCTGTVWIGGAQGA